jgi:ATP-dependent helicase/nuclease subunit A
VTGPPRVPRDHAARRTAATDFTTNFVVAAGAGTGKTTLLVERILTAIGSGVAALSEIAAITFTDKAAGELRLRLASGLRRLREAPDAVAAQCGASPEDVARRAAEAEASLDRATVTTIHGFCAEILRAYPLECGLPPGFAADRGLAGRRLAEEEWTPFLEDELGPSGRRAELWERVLGAFTLAQLEELARALAGGAISEGALRADLPALDLRAVLGSEAQHLAAEIRAVLDRTAGLTEAPRAWLTQAERALHVFADDGAAAARRSIEDAPRLAGRMSSVRTKNVSAAEADELSVLESRALPLLRGLSAYDEQAERDLLQALLPFARRLRARRARRRPSQCLQVAPGEDDVIAVLQKGARDGLADAGAGARDDRDLARLGFHGRSFW